MKAFAKLIGLVVFGVILLGVGVLFFLTRLFDPNDYKDDIQQAARDKAHRAPLLLVAVARLGPLGQRQHPQTPPGQCLGPVVPVLQVDTFAHPQHTLWRALHIDRGMSIMVVMQSRHKAVFGVKRNGISSANHQNLSPDAWCSGYPTSPNH